MKNVCEKETYCIFEATFIKFIYKKLLKSHAEVAHFENSGFCYFLSEKWTNLIVRSVIFQIFPKPSFFNQNFFLSDKLVHYNKQKTGVRYFQRVTFNIKLSLYMLSLQESAVKVQVCQFFHDFLQGAWTKWRQLA